LQGSSATTTMKNLTITVSGKTNTGKSRLTLLLKDFLRKEDFKVEFDGGIDYENEEQFNDHVSKNFDHAIEQLKETTITLKEEQLNAQLQG
jgi:hypothetical protein